MAPHAEINEFANGNGFSSTPGNKELFTVNSPNVLYTDNEINTKYTYRTTSVTKDENGKYIATPKETLYDFKVDRRVPKTGVMLVGWGGNNGKSGFRVEIVAWALADHMCVKEPLSLLAFLLTVMVLHGPLVRVLSLLTTMAQSLWDPP